MHRMERAVHLTGARCDGSAHGGCQTACQFYWKEVWLRKVEPAVEPSAPSAPTPTHNSILLPLLVSHATAEPAPDGDIRYRCQATELLRAAPTCLPLYDFRQYAEDVRSGNSDARTIAVGFLVGLFNRFQVLSVRRLPRRMRFRKGLRWRFLEGQITGRTPTAEIGLQPGELVRVKTREEILATLDRDLQNRGLGFEEEMERYCGTVVRVKSRVDRCIDERSGRMLTMKSPCIILENVVCAGYYNVSCPRAFIPFWREAWLERVSADADG
jgi:hypothetical protein